MATGNIPNIVVGTEAPGYAQGMATDVNDGINRINSALGAVNTDIAALQAAVVTPGTSVKVTYNARGQITAGGTAQAADITDFNTAVRTNSLDQMTAPAADVSFNSKKITSLADATSATDALNRQSGDARYVNVTGDSMNAALRFGQNSTDDPAAGATNGGAFYGASSDAWVSVSRFLNPCLLLNMNSDAQIALFYRGGSPVGSISVSGAGTTFDTTSDYRLKEDLEPMIAPLDRLRALRSLSFHWKADEKREYKTDGFLAHEVQKIVPGAVRGEKDDEAPQMLDYSRLVPLLIGAVQELSAKVERLERRSPCL